MYPPGYPLRRDTFLVRRLCTRYPLRAITLARHRKLIGLEIQSLLSGPLVGGQQLGARIAQDELVF